MLSKVGQRPANHDRYIDFRAVQIFFRYAGRAPAGRLWGVPQGWLYAHVCMN